MKRSHAPSQPAAAATESVGLHFSYRNSRPHTRNKQPAHTRPRRANVLPPLASSPAVNEFPALSSSPKPLSSPKPSSPSFSPSGSWAQRALGSASKSPATSSPISKMARPSESPLVHNTRSSARRSLDKENESRAKLFAKPEKQPVEEKPEVPDLDALISAHNFTTDSWADIMDEVDSIHNESLSTRSRKSSNSLASLPTSDINENSVMDSTLDSLAPIDLEALQQRRSKQIAFGKNTPEYQEYIKKVPLSRRRKRDPRTPDKDQTVSRRNWDAQVRKWKLGIKQWAEQSYKLNAANLAKVLEAGEKELNCEKHLANLAEAVESSPLKNSTMSQINEGPKALPKNLGALLGISSWNVSPSKKPEPATKKVSAALQGSPSKSPMKRSLAAMAARNAVETSPYKRSLRSHLVDESSNTCMAVDESSSSTLIGRGDFDESSCASTDMGWRVTPLIACENSVSCVSSASTDEDL